MTRSKKIWVYNPPKSAKPKVSEAIKTKVLEKTNALIETVLKPQHIKPPPKNPQFNYLVDIYGKWYRNYFYLCGKYHCPCPNDLFPSFEGKFMRLEYVGENQYNLSYMRHTEQWWEIKQGISLEACLKTMREYPLLQP